MTSSTKQCDALIVGQGAPAFGAALYTVRYQMKTIVIGDIFGGETTAAGIIEYEPRYPEIEGYSCGGEGR